MPALFRDGLAPRMTNTQLSNVWDEFARGLFTFYITGPWNIGEFRRRLAGRASGRLGRCAPAGPGRTGRIDRWRLEPRHLQGLAPQGGGVEADRLPERDRDDAALPRAHRRPAAAAQRLARARRWPTTRRRRRSRSSSSGCAPRPRFPSGSASSRRCSSCAERVVQGQQDARGRLRAARCLGRRAARKAPLAARREAAHDEARRGRLDPGRPGAGRDRRLLRAAGRCRAGAQPHRLRPLRAGRPVDAALRRPAQLPAPAADAALLAGAGQHVLLRRRRRAGVDRPVAGRGAAARLRVRALAAVLPHRRCSRRWSRRWSRWR